MASSLDPNYDGMNATDVRHNNDIVNGPLLIRAEVTGRSGHLMLSPDVYCWDIRPLEKVVVFPRALQELTTTVEWNVESGIPTSTVLHSTAPDYNYACWVEFPFSPQPSLVSEPYAIVLTVAEPRCVFMAGTTFYPGTAVL
jgi:hypothetical protein